MTFLADTRADSNTIGFILIISIFLIGGVTLFGASISIFDSAGETPGDDAAEQLTNLRSTFQDFSSGAPYRQTTVSLTDGSLKYGDTPVGIEVDVRNYDGSSTGKGPVSASTVPVVYSYDGGEVRYVNGVIVLSDDTGGALVKTTGTWRIGDYSRFPLLELTPTDPDKTVGASGGARAVQIDGYASTPSVVSWTGETNSATDPNYRVEVTYTGLKSPSAWEQHFNGLDGVSVLSTGSDSISIEFETDRIIVRSITVDTTLGV